MKPGPGSPGNEVDAERPNHARRASMKPGPGWLRLARAVRRIRSVRVLLLGVHPDHHGRGIAPLLAGEAARIARGRGVRSGELSLIQAGNEPMRHVVEAFGCPRVRRFGSICGTSQPLPGKSLIREPSRTRPGEGDRPGGLVPDNPWMPVQLRPFTYFEFRGLPWAIHSTAVAIRLSRVASRFASDTHAM